MYKCFFKSPNHHPGGMKSGITDSHPDTGKVLPLSLVPLINICHFTGKPPNRVYGRLIANFYICFRLKNQ